ncbi:universal stress protein [Azotobacter sp. CWF10]
MREWQIDLLLMGAVARGHLDNALIGNTAERVLEALECDLLVLKPQPGAGSAG